MKISRKKLLALVSEAMREQREEPGLSHARSELAYGHPDGGGKTLRKKFNKASRRQSAREISWSLADIDGDGDLDLRNNSSVDDSTRQVTGSEMSEIIKILEKSGILDDSNRAIFDKIRKYGDDNTPGDDPDDAVNAFLANLAVDTAFDDDRRLSREDVERLSNLSLAFNGALESASDEVMDLQRRDMLDDYLRDVEDHVDESRERVMSENFGRNDIKAFFAQTLYEDFETSKPRKRRSTGILTEVEDHSPSPLDENGRNRLAQAIVTGINLEFDINASGPALVDLEEQVQHHLAKHPELPAILFDIAMDAIPSDDESDYYREEILRQVGSEVFNAMDSTSLKRDDLQRLVDDMIAADRFSRENFDAAGIDFADVVEKVEEFEREYGDDPPPRY